MDKKWNQFYENHGRFYLLPHPSLTEFMEQCRRRGIQKVLDLGCGSGRHLIKLAEEGFKVAGVDFSPSAAQLAEKWLHQKGYEGDIIVGNFDDKMQDFPDKSFGGIIAVNSLEYGNKEELEQNLEQIKKILRPGGIFMMVYRSKESEMKHPEIETRFMGEDELKEVVTAYLHVIKIIQDQKNNFVVFAESSTKGGYKSPYPENSRYKLDLHPGNSRDIVEL